MQLNNIDGAWLALIGTIFGGAGLKSVDSWLGRSRVRQEQELSLREELRSEITSIREELAKSKVEELRLETELDAWKTKFYQQFVLITEKATELTIATNKIESLYHDIEGFKERISGLEERVHRIASDRK